jgi:hypothetical protein
MAFTHRMLALGSITGIAVAVVQERILIAGVGRHAEALMEKVLRSVALSVPKWQR